MARGNDKGGRKWLVAGGGVLLLFVAAAGGEAAITIVIVGGVVWFLARLGRKNDKADEGRKRGASARGASRTGLTAHHTPIRAQDRQSEAVQRRYFDLMQDLEGAKSRGDFDRALASASASVELLPQFVEAWKREQGRIGGEASFDLSTIPAIDTLCQLGPARGDAELLEEVRTYLTPVPDLHPWVEKLDRAIEDAGAAVAVVKRVADEPGVRQAGLAKSMGLDGRRVRSALYWMERDGELVRVKEGSTHRLYLPDEVPEETSPAIEAGSTGTPTTISAAGVTAPVSFAAIDCETATGNRNSVCAVGLVVVREGQIVERCSWLMQPPGNHYWSTNIAVHGISPLDTGDAEPIADLWADIHRTAEGLPLVAHNAAFDRSAISTSLAEAGWQHPINYQWYCTLTIARRTWPELSNHTLPTVAAHCGHALTRHHDAAADAEAAAQIAIAACTALSVRCLSETGSAH